MYAFNVRAKDKYLKKINIRVYTHTYMNVCVCPRVYIYTNSYVCTYVYYYLGGANIYN